VTYSEKAEKLGVSVSELQAAGNQVAQYGIPDRLAGRILRDERGPEITVYLAKNLMVLDSLSSMEPEDAAIYLETVIKPKARKEPPHIVPAPVESVKGSGVSDDDPDLRGAKFE